MRYLDVYLEEFERNCTAVGGVVHWADRCGGGAADRCRAGEGGGSDEVIKIKSMTTEEIQLNKALRLRG